MGDVADAGRGLQVGCAAGDVCDRGNGEGAVGGEHKRDVGREPVEECRAGVVAGDVLVDHEEDGAIGSGGTENGGYGRGRRDFCRDVLEGGSGGKQRRR